MAILRELLFIANFVTCVCYQEQAFLQEQAFSDKICSDEEIEFEARGRSEIACSIQCQMEKGCNSFVYHEENSTCYGIKLAISCAVFVNLQGAIFYRSHPLPKTTPGLGCSTSEALLPAVNDSQVTASSIYRYQPYYARLYSNRSWAPKTTAQGQFIQAHCCSDYWVKSYKFLASAECVNYQAVLDETNNPKNFKGVTDRYNNSIAYLTTALNAQCFRISPVTYHNYPVLRFDLLGCPP